MSQYTQFPTKASATWQSPVATAAALPGLGNLPGDVKIALDTNAIYVWNGTAWILEVTPGASPPGGANGQIQYNNFGAFAGSAGLTYNSGTLALVVGGTITASNFTGSSSGINTGDVTLAAVGASPNANGATLTGQILNLQPATAAFPGALTAADWSTFNAKQPAGNYITALTGDVTAAGPGSVAATVVSVGGSTAANINTATIAANAATSANTANTIAKRDANGNINQGVIFPQVTKTANFTITAANDIIFCDTSGGAFSLTLPPPVAGKLYRIIDSTGNFGTNNLTLVRNAAEKIEGLAASKVLQTNWGWFNVTSNGTDWFVG